jgi:hypothetical protein
MEFEGLLPSQDPEYAQYPEPVESSSHPHILLLKINFTIISSSRLQEK